VNPHELLDRAADEALLGRRVHPADVRVLASYYRTRRVRRVVAGVAAGLLVIVPLTALAISRSGRMALLEPAGPTAPLGRSVVPDRLPVLHGDVPAVVDGSGAVRARRLSMAFLGSLHGQEGLYGLDAATGRPVRLPQLGDELPGLAVPEADGSLDRMVPASVSLSPDGRTVVTSHQDGAAAYDIVLDLATGRATAYRQTAPAGPLGERVLTVAAADDGRFVVPSDDLTGVRVLSVADATARVVRLEGIDASDGLVLDPQADGTVLVTARHDGADWMWVVDPAKSGEGSDVVRGFAAPWVATSGWSASQTDGLGRFVSVDADGTVSAHAPSASAPEPLRQLRVAPANPAAVPRLVAAVDGRLLVTDDARQRVTHAVSSARARTLSEVTADGGLRPLTRLTDGASHGGDGQSGFVVAQRVVAAAQVVSARDDAWWQRGDVSLWLLGVAAIAVVGLAMRPKGVRPR
jgi:hypothetical protein